MEKVYLDYICSELDIAQWQAENCVALLEEGATVPFISRYRKERTGGLDETQVSEIKFLMGKIDELDKRKQTVLKTIEAAGKLTEELSHQIGICIDLKDLEDLYLPFKPKRHTRASAAKEKGLEPLAKRIFEVSCHNPYDEAAKQLKSGKIQVSEDEAVAGACDIVSEWISELKPVRDFVRSALSQRGVLVCKKAKKAVDESIAGKYESYLDHSEPLRKMPAHRVLAVLRAEAEGVLSIKIDTDAEKICNKIEYDHCKNHRFPSGEMKDILRSVIEDSYKRLIYPSISSEVIREAKERADLESIRLFGENLKQLLLAPPLGEKRIMAIDPGFRTGCKVVCLSESGELLCNDVIYPHPPQNEKISAMDKVLSMVEKYRIEAVAVGSGTAGRETEAFLKKAGLPEGVKIYLVCEDGASVYSASDIAREEFPDYDLTVRGAVSIGRRLMDPLAELVKIDPKSIGVGQYQHDVDQVMLKERLDEIVGICVNSVGVNLNTASRHLLTYVSGIGPALAENILAYRNEKGGFRSRKDLLKVKRLGDKAYEQCAGFLRIPHAVNPLDNSAVHPESYGIVDKMASNLKVEVGELIGNNELLGRIKASDYVSDNVGLPTINDILKELAKPGRDPRASITQVEFDASVSTIDDLRPGMELPGIVTNITAFGAFVDMGIKENGLIHVSKMRGRKLTSLKLREHITVIVESVDTDRKRISLSLKV